MIEKLQEEIQQLEQDLLGKEPPETYPILSRIKIAHRTLFYLQNPSGLYNKKYFNRHFVQYRGWEKELAQDLVKR